MVSIHTAEVAKGMIGQRMCESSKRYVETRKLGSEGKSDSANSIKLKTGSRKSHVVTEPLFYQGV
jgi:hypothetical protein